MPSDVGERAPSHALSNWNIRINLPSHALPLNDSSESDPEVPYPFARSMSMYMKASISEGDSNQLQTHC